MQPHEQELLIARIMSGYVRHVLSSNLTVLVKTATVVQNYIAQEVFHETYELAREHEIFTTEDMLNIMIECGMWDTMDNKREKQIPKDIENIKVQMFKDAFKLEQRETKRKILRKMEEQFFKVKSKRHAYDFVTCEGVATYARWNWLIENCTYRLDGSPYDWTDIGISNVLERHKDAMLGDTHLRKLSMNNSWRGVWSAAKKEGSIFGKPSVELSEEQRGLCMWSSLYDGVYESPEAPVEEVITDDDLLDGWLISQRRKSDKEKKQKKADDILGKNANADEVFIMAHNREDALEVEDLNDEAISMVKRERRRAKENAEGFIKDADLPDVRRNILTQAREQFKNRR